jgi:hypothetical protein
MSCFTCHTKSPADMADHATRGAKLLDFNIASRVGDPVRTLAGTPPYQPPDPTSHAGKSPPICSQWE